MRGPSFLSFWLMSNLTLVPTALAAYLAEPELPLELIKIPDRICGLIFLVDPYATCPGELPCDPGDIMGLGHADQFALSEAGRACRARPGAQVALEVMDGELQSLVLLDEHTTEIELCMREALGPHRFQSPTRLAVGSVYAR